MSRKLFENKKIRSQKTYEVVEAFHKVASYYSDMDIVWRDIQAVYTQEDREAQARNGLKNAFMICVQQHKGYTHRLSWGETERDASDGAERIAQFVTSLRIINSHPFVAVYPEFLNKIKRISQYDRYGNAQVFISFHGDDRFIFVPFPTDQEAADGEYIMKERLRQHLCKGREMPVPEVLEDQNSNMLFLPRFLKK